MTVRSTNLDTKREQRVIERIEEAWGVKTSRNGYLDSFDLFGVRDGKTVFIGEIKTRNVASDAYPTIYLAVHKWLTLLMASKAMGVKGLFVVAFNDGQILWADVAKIDARNNQVAGRYDRPGAANDQELMILVPLADFKAIDTPQPVAA